MKVLFYSSKRYEEPHLINANSNHYEIKFIRESLNINTAVLSEGFDAISIFANDDASADVIRILKKNNVKLIAIRATGYDNTDIAKAAELNIKVVNVPDYSPEGIAEHTVAMMLCLSKKLIKANQQIQEHNYALDGLVGFNLYQKTVGIIGVGKIGKALARILNGFGCRILGYDINPDVEAEKKYNITYTSLEHLCRSADIISLHLPLSDTTKYLINEKTLKLMKYNVMIINTARGGIIHTKDLIKHLKSKHIGYAGLDVYENEKEIFFMNHFGKKVEDSCLLELLEMPNVLITPHQAFATTESLEKIAQITFHNMYCWANHLPLQNELKVEDEKMVSTVTY